jgi:hypothetical protein
MRDVGLRGRQQRDLLPIDMNHMDEIELRADRAERFEMHDGTIPGAGQIPVRIVRDGAHMGRYAGAAS